MSKIFEATEIFVPRYLKLQQLLERHEREHWIPTEADMRADIEQWRNGKISEVKKQFAKMILRFFTQADTDVCAGYVEKLLPVFKNADARMLLLSFASRETTHMLGYKRLNDSLGLDSEGFSKEFLEYDAMREKHEYMIGQVDMRSTKGRAEYLAKQILMEGVNLFASFAMLLNYSRAGLLPGMVSVNQWSQIDESMHVEGLTEIFAIVLEENPHVVNDEFKKTVYQFARDVIAMEDASIDLAFSVGEVYKKGDADYLDKQDVKDYIRFVADFRMQKMGFKPQFGITKNPMPWIDDVTGRVFGDFFDTTITEYSKDNLSGDWEY